MAPRLILSATAAASWVHRRTSSSRSRSLRRRKNATTNNTDSEGIQLSDGSGANFNCSDCDNRSYSPSAAAKAEEIISKNNSKSRRRARSTIRRCEQSNATTNTTADNSSSSKRAVMMKRSRASCFITPPRHGHDRSRRRHRSYSDRPHTATDNNDDYPPILQPPMSNARRRSRSVNLIRKETYYSPSLSNRKSSTPPQLSFEQQLLQQEPPPPFILPRSFTPNRSTHHRVNEMLPSSSLSFEEQLLQQPEIINLHANIGVEGNSFGGGPHYTSYNEQSSFANATANCDGSSVIYFRNDSSTVCSSDGSDGERMRRRRRCTSLPPPLVRNGSGLLSAGVALCGNGVGVESRGSARMVVEEEGQIIRLSGGHSNVGGGSSPSSYPPPPPRGANNNAAASFHRNNNSRSTSMPPPLVRKAPYKAASSESIPLPHHHHHPLFTPPRQQSSPPPMKYYPPSKDTIINPQEYERLQHEAELVNARMREIEERIRDIEWNRSNSSHGVGAGAGAPSIALGGGAFVGDENSVEGGDDDLIGSIGDCCDKGSEVSEDSYYSDLVEEEEDNEDTIGDLLSSVSLLNNSRYQSDDEDTAGSFPPSTSLAMRPLLEREEEKKGEESDVDIQGKRISVSNLNLCESTSSVSIATKNDDDGSAASTDDNTDNDRGESSTDLPTSRRKVRFDDDGQYRHPVMNVSSSSPSSQASITCIDDSISHQSRDGNDQRGDHEKLVKYQRQSSGCGSVGSTGSCDSNSIASTTSSASNSSGDYHTLKTLLARPKKNRRRRNVCNHSTISAENEFCDDCGHIVSGPTPTTKNALAISRLTQKKAASDSEKGDNLLSRHVGQPQTRNSLERKGTHSSTNSASSISTLLEHAPLEVHFAGLQKRRSKLLEMVEAREQDSVDKKTKRSIEFSLFLMKDKLSQLQDLGVLGEEDEDEILKAGGTRRLLRKIKSEGANRRSGRKEVSPYKRSSTATGPKNLY